MDEITKRLTYALHDTYGYHEDEEKNTKLIIDHLFEHGLSLTRHEDQDAWYRQGRTDALWEAAQETAQLTNPKYEGHWD
jgi:hypothetical protein